MGYEWTMGYEPHGQGVAGVTIAPDNGFRRAQRIEYSLFNRLYDRRK